jgi:hypothetical protein
MIHIPRQLYQKIQFNKSLHSSPQLAIEILFFFGCTDCDRPLAARSGNTPTQLQRPTTTAYTAPIPWGICLENDLKYANLGCYVTISSSNYHE